MLLNRISNACEITVRNLQEYLTSNLKTLRLYEGLTQEQVSEIAMISRSTYSRIESGKATPDLQVLCLLADYYEIGIDLLVGTDLKKSMRKQ